MNIGGSILPSNCPEILQPIPCAFGTLRVVPIPEIDTHVLTLSTSAGTFTIASHPNGYSCHSLAKHMAEGNTDKAVKQADYIVACGGTSVSHKVITDIITL